MIKKVARIVKKSKVPGVLDTIERDGHKTVPKPREIKLAEWKIADPVKKDKKPVANKAKHDGKGRIIG